jgi:hypothetical protein
MQPNRPRRLRVAVAVAMVAAASSLAARNGVWEVALSVCTSAIDLADNMAGLPCRIAKSFRTLPERMDPTCSDCNKP